MGRRKPNTRQKAKEKLESMHRNLEWVQYHCSTLGPMVEGKNDTMEEMLLCIIKSCEQMDGWIKAMYSIL